MSDDDSYDTYGDTDANNVPDGGSGQNTSAGDGLPGFPVDGYPEWRAGVFSAPNLLGLVRTSDLTAQPGGDPPATLQFGADQAPFGGAADPRLMLASDRLSADPGMPAAYMPDGHGGVQLRPGFAATHPNGPLDFSGMAKEINWPGVAGDLAKIAAGVAGSVAMPFIPRMLGLAAAPVEGAGPNPWVTAGSLAWRGARTLHNQEKANPRNADPVVRPDVDETTDGLP